MNPSCGTPLARLTNVTFLSQFKKMARRVSEGLATLEKLRFVGVVGEENLTVVDVLVDFVLRVGRVRVGLRSEEMAKSKKVGDESGDDGNGVAMSC